jgi:demethylmenaquinone methyltransferase/2-methoxy-6-polyprenyl-1,4-benzoquinol methylase
MSGLARFGAAPEGAQDERAAAAAVRQMFSQIAPRYDLLNHLLSFNMDKLWWRRAARTFAPILRRGDARVLDLCCGTGDMTLALRKVAGVAGGQIIALDFAHPMLTRAVEKAAGKRVAVIEADALRLPLPDQSFDLATSAFGFRNLANYDQGLREIHRVLKPGGEVGILDFGEPDGIIGKLYRIYFHHVLPKVGTVISGVRGPYAYLPASVERFPGHQVMLERMALNGFTQAGWMPYTYGVAGLYQGRR